MIYLFFYSSTGHKQNCTHKSYANVSRKINIFVRSFAYTAGMNKNSECRYKKGYRGAHVTDLFKPVA